MIHSTNLDEDLCERMLEDETINVLFANVDVWQDELDNNMSSSCCSSFSDIDEPIPLSDDDEICMISSHESRHIYPTVNAWGCLNETQIECQSESSSSSCSGAVSPLPRALMDKLAKCMDRSALSRSLVETYCQVSLAKPPTTKGISESQDLRAEHPAITRRNNSIKHSLKKQRRFQHECTPEKQRVVRRRQTRLPTVLEKESAVEKTFDFRLSGLKLSEDKLQRLDAKMKLLDQFQVSPEALTEKESLTAMFRVTPARSSVRSSR
jgi:hypothetical protein